MSVKERDPLTGHLTTGHEWNGIKELNTRVPRVVWFFIIVTHVWAVIIWILLPAWPLVTTYTGGLLGLDQREEVEEDIAAANRARADVIGRIDATSVGEIRADADLMRYVSETAHAVYGDNCAVCHGAKAAGGPGFPSLVDKAWLWGGSPDEIMETLRVGINSQHPDTRTGQMLAFGREGMLEREQIHTLVAYVQSLSGGEISDDQRTEGAELFADNCASCHGDGGHGMTDVGAPDLTDDFWIYGGDKESIFKTIWDGRQGWMPAWEGRLTEAQRKILTVHILNLAGKDTP